MAGTPPVAVDTRVSGSVPTRLEAWLEYFVVKQFCWFPFSTVPPRQISDGPVVVDPAVTLRVMKLSTSTLPVPKVVEEIVAVGEAGQVKFKILVLKTVSLAPAPVPFVDNLASAGPKSWTAFWAETAEAVVAMQTTAKP